MMEKRKIPALRFQGFTDEWEEKAIGELSEKNYGGGTPRTSEELFWNGDIPWFQSADLIENEVLTARPKKKITSYGLYNSAAQLIPKNSIAIVTRVGVGKLAFIPFPYTTSQDFLSLSQLKIDGKFGCYVLYRALQRNKAKTQGTSIKGITKEEILREKVLLPSQEEQIKIGSFLSVVDSLTSFEKYRLDKLQAFKKSMLEKMFPRPGGKVPEVRFCGFTGDWEERRFGELVDIERGGSPRPIDEYITDDYDGLNWVKIGDAPAQGRYIMHTEEKIKASGLSKTRQVFPGDLILSNSMSFGKPYIMGISGCIHDGWLLIRNSRNLFDLKFLCQMLGTEHMLSQYKSLAAGSTVNNLNKELVSNVIVNVPPLEEQVRIGVFLEKIDDIISCCQRKLEKLQSLKQAMLSEMFI